LEKKILDFLSKKYSDFNRDYLETTEAFTMLKEFYEEIEQENKRIKQENKNIKESHDWDSWENAKAKHYED